MNTPLTIGRIVYRVVEMAPHDDGVVREWLISESVYKGEDSTGDEILELLQYGDKVYHYRSDAEQKRDFLNLLGVTYAWDVAAHDPEPFRFRVKGGRTWYSNAQVGPNEGVQLYHMKPCSNGGSNSTSTGDG